MAHDTIPSPTGVNLSAHALPTVGLACCLATSGLFDTALSSVVSSGTFAVRTTSDALTGGIAMIAACIALALLARTNWLNERRFGPAPLAIFAVLQAAAVGLLVAHGAGILPDLAGIVGGLALGAVSTVLLALWARACARMGTGFGLNTLAAALALLTLCSLVITQLPDVVVAAAGMCAAVASPGLLYVFDSARNPDQTGQPTPSPVLATRDSMPWWSVLLVCTAGYGVVMGCVQSLGNSFETDGFGSFLLSYSINIGALVTAVAALGVARMPQCRALLRVGILITLMAALYFSGIFGLASGPAGMLFMTVSRMATFLLIWAIACDAPLWKRSEGCWSVFAFSCGWGAFSLANTVSTKLGLAVASSSAAYLAYNVLVILVLVALIALEILPQKLGSAKRTPEADEAPSPDDLLQERCRVFGQQHGLTPREIEVLLPLVRGRGAATIATILGVSPETARTHIRHIYAKTGIHNREDLMDAIEEERA